MSLLIKGMKMPKPYENGLETTMRLVLSSSGLVELIDPDKNTLLEEYRAIEVPTPHGRLGDLDALMELYEPALEDANEWEHYTTTISIIRQNIKDQPTIIEAEEDEDDIL